jgi:hypothetical protein
LPFHEKRLPVIAVTPFDPAGLGPGVHLDRGRKWVLSGNVPGTVQA